MKFIKELLKIISAGIVSVAIVCGLLCFYDIKPIHKENPKRNTDYVCPPNSIWVKATEGIAFGKNDANGFNKSTIRTLSFSAPLIWKLSMLCRIKTPHIFYLKN